MVTSDSAARTLINQTPSPTSPSRLLYYTLQKAGNSSAPPGVSRPVMITPSLISSLTYDPRDEVSSYITLMGTIEGALNVRPSSIVEEIERSGLRGRGGAWFPTHLKWKAATSTRRRPVVVVNATEGEPASSKDALLMTTNPNLVIDGALVCAYATRATRVVFCVPPGLTSRVTEILQIRAKHSKTRIGLEVIGAPERYVTGEASALVNFINTGAQAMPTFTQLLPVYRSGVANAPTIVQNAETLANVALIARHGAGWFRTVGTVQSPGTVLLTLSGATRVPVVVEVEVGTTLRSVLGLVGDLTGPIQAVLVGGYGASWHSSRSILDTALAPESLQKLGGSLGPGVVFLLGAQYCPVSQLAGLARWMANQGAGQCGPCVSGLPAIATYLEVLAQSRAKADTPERVLSLCKLVESRGACHHPDGVARMVRSALDVFRQDIEVHLARKSCGKSHKLSLPTHNVLA